MKQLLILVLLCCVAVHVQAQSVSKLSIMKVIKEDFPKSEDIEISMKCGSFEVAFFQNNDPVIACYNDEGELKLTTYLIEEAKLPKDAKAYIGENFASLNITEILKKESSDQEVEYMVRFQDNSRIYFDKAGTRKEMYSNCRNN